MAITNFSKKRALEAFILSAAKLRLYTSDSDPDIDGTGFVEVPDGNGYVSGGVNLGAAGSDWNLDQVDGEWRATLISDHYWTATGGSIDDVAGLYVLDSDNNVLAWWARDTPVTIHAEDVIRVAGVYVESSDCAGA